MKLHTKGSISRKTRTTKIASWAAIAALTLASPISAIAVEVDSVASLKEAVIAAKSGDTITLKKGTYTFSDKSVGMGDGGYQSKTPYLLIIDKDLTIEGEDDSPRSEWKDHAEPVIIDGNNVGGFLHINNNKKVTVKNITFTRGTVFANYTAPIYSASNAASIDNVVLTNCVFRQNTRDSVGYSGTFSAILKDCLVSNNTYTAIRACKLFNCDIIDSAYPPFSGVSAYDSTFHSINTTQLGDIFVSGLNHLGVLSNCTIQANSFDTRIANNGLMLDCKILTNKITNASTSKLSLIGANAMVRGCRFEGNSLGLTTQTILPEAYSCTNCTFIGNTCKYIALNPVNLVGCTFESNYGEGGGAAVTITGSISTFLDGCFFARNKGDYTGSKGGAIYMKRTASNLSSLVVTNCTFEGNSAGSTGGAIYNDDAALPEGENSWDYCKVYNSTFTTNSAAHTAGIYGVHAVNCTFDGNIRRNPSAGYHLGNAARNSFLQNCDINDGDIYNCIVDRCRIHDVPNNVWHIFREYTRATNCLIEKCTLEAHGTFYSSDYEIFDAEFVNCTIVSNIMYTYSAGGSAHTTNSLSFVNCILNGNKNKYYVTDLTVYKVAANMTDKLEYVTFLNTYYGAIDPYISTRGEFDFAKFSAKTNAPNAFMLCADPKFAGLDKRTKELYPDAPFWSLSLKSPLLGKGAFSDWMTNAKDLAGSPRSNNGTVDVGCYQCWLIPFGTMIIIK